MFCIVKYEDCLDHKENIATVDVLADVHESKCVKASHHVFLSCIDNRKSSRYGSEDHLTAKHESGWKYKRA